MRFDLAQWMLWESCVLRICGSSLCSCFSGRIAHMAVIKSSSRAGIHACCSNYIFFGERINCNWILANDSAADVRLGRASAGRAALVRSSIFRDSFRLSGISNSFKEYTQTSRQVLLERPPLTTSGFGFTRHKFSLSRI